MNLRSIVPDEVPAPARLFLCGTVLNGIGNGVFSVVIQLYLISLGLSSSSLGSIFMMNAIGTTILTIPVGILADRYGKKRITLLGLASVAISVTLILTTRSVEMFMVGFLVIGVSNAAGVVFSPLYSSFFDREDMDKAFGLWGSLNIVTMSMGSLLGFIPPFLVKNYGFSLQASYWIFLAVGSFFFVSQYLFYLMSIQGTTEPVKEGGFNFTLSSRGFVLKFGLISLISAASYGIFIGLFPFYVNRKFGIESDALGILFFASNFVSAGAQAVAPRISKEMGALRTIVVSIGLATPFYLMMPLAPSFAWLSALYIARLGFVTLAQPLLNSTFMKHLGDEEKSTANSIRMMSMQGGSVIGPWLGGQLMERASLNLPAYLGGGLYAVLTVLTFFLLGNVGGRIGFKPLQVLETACEDTLRSDSKPTPLAD